MKENNSQINFKIPKLSWKENKNMMPVHTVIEEVAQICKDCDVKHLALFGSFAKGLSHPNSDIDLVVYGCTDFIDLEDKIEDQILTVREINLFDYDTIKNKELLKDIKDYAIQIC